MKNTSPFPADECTIFPFFLKFPTPYYICFGHSHNLFTPDHLSLSLSLPLRPAAHSGLHHSHDGDLMYGTAHLSNTVLLYFA